MIVIAFIAGMIRVGGHLLLHVDQRSGVAMVTICQNHLLIFHNFHKAFNGFRIANDTQNIPNALIVFGLADRALHAVIHEFFKFKCLVSIKTVGRAGIQSGCRE